MVETTLKVRHPLGLHARPAVKFVQTAASFHSKVEIINLSGSDRKADAKSILGILSINVGQNQEIKIIVDGPDEEQAIAALTELVEDNFGEPDDLTTRKLN